MHVSCAQVLRHEADLRWSTDPAGDRNEANAQRGGLGQMLAGDVNACVVYDSRCADEHGLTIRVRRYLDFEWAVDTLTRRDDAFTHDAQLNPCAAALQHGPSRREATVRGGEPGAPPLFFDAWEVLHRPEPDSGTSTGGYTFPNPQTRPNDPSRPDRILMRTPELSNKRAGLQPLRTAILGCDPIGRDSQGPLCVNACSVEIIACIHPAVIATSRRYMSDHRFLVADFACAEPGCGVGPPR